ncbi:MAG: hypothetical protein JO370_09310 [Paucibacter sp.]|nr:hypothetical protein [Roseateles sp.]
MRYLETAPQDLFGRYVVDLLTTAVERSGLPLQLSAVPSFHVSQGRLEQELIRPASRLDLMWYMTSRSREQMLCPLRIPLDRGLLGWRVAVIRRADLSNWASPPDRLELARRRAGQGLHWPDVDILKANGFQVDTAEDSRALYRMLELQRIDYFPRSVLEVRDELSTFPTQPMMVAPGLALRYPTAVYAFLSPRHRDLVTPLTEQLRMLVHEGTVGKLFRNLFQSRLDDLDLSRRSVIQLVNPLLPAETPLQRSDLWWKP